MMIALLDGIAAIRDDNSATLWRMAESSGQGEQLECRDITEFVAASELLRLIRGAWLEIPDEQVWATCSRKLYKAKEHTARHERDVIRLAQNNRLKLGLLKLKYPEVVAFMRAHTSSVRFYLAHETWLSSAGGYVVVSSLDDDSTVFVLDRHYQYATEDNCYVAMCDALLRCHIDMKDAGCVSADVQRIADLLHDAAKYLEDKDHSAFEHTTNYLARQRVKPRSTKEAK